MEFKNILVAAQLICSFSKNSLMELEFIYLDMFFRTIGAEIFLITISDGILTKLHSH